MSREGLADRPTVSGEHADAVALANRVLDRINADPDDDLALLARQFLRCCENAAAWHGIVDAAATILELPHGAPSPREFGADVQALARKIAEAKRDAERYRWLRIRFFISNYEWHLLGIPMTHPEPDDPSHVDAAIDAAMQSTQETRG